MNSSEKDMCHYTNTPTYEEVDRPHERDITFMPAKACQEVKRTKLVFLYSDEDEDISEHKQVNDSKTFCIDNSLSSNKSKIQQLTQEELVEELPHSNKKAEFTGAHCNVKEVSTSSLQLHADLCELQEDAEHIKKRACENENINSDVCTSKMNDFPFYEDVALPQESRAPEDLIQGHTMHVKEVEVETLPYAARRRYTTDRHHYKNNNLNNLRTHFTIDEFANTHIDCKRLRNGNTSCENNSNNEQQEESKNEKSYDADIDACKENNENEIHQFTSSSNDAHVDATLALDTNEDKQNENIVVTDSNQDNNTVFDCKNSDNEDNDDSDEVVQVHCIKPIVSDDGKVHVVESNGYCLTVNEEDLLDLGSELNENDAISGEVDKTSIDRWDENNNENVAICHDEINITNNLTQAYNEKNEHENEDSEEQSHYVDDVKEEKVEVEEEQEVLEDQQEVKEIVEENDNAWAEEDEDDYEEDDDEEESDEELDQCLLVAIVDRLVECCESPDLDSNLNIEAARFCAVAKPLLTQLRNDEITYETFDKNIHKQLHRFMRVYKSVYRPRDAPIIINGVQMDL